jgi:chaperonin GroES
MKELQPLNDNVLLEITDEFTETKTPSGIILPDSAKEKPSVGKILAMGNIEEPAIQPGDVVLYKKFSGNKVELDGKEYLILPYADILAKVSEVDKI